MVQRVQYKTKQMNELLSYLKTVQGSHVTVNDICGYFKEKGISVGTTTVYRQLERMVDQGMVVKYAADGMGGACFEYIGEQDPHDRPAAYHCKCENCGDLIHLQCDEVANLGQHMLEHHGFEMNSARTIFYGICDSCRVANG